MPNEDNHPSALPRRRILAAGAVGVAAAAIGATGFTLTRSGHPAAENAAPDAPAEGPIVVHVRDLSAGTLDVFTGSTHHEVRDRDLAVRLANAAHR